MEKSDLILKVREKIRQNTQLNRNKSRIEENDAFRLGLGEIQSLVEELENLTEKDVHGLCTRIKRRKHAGPDDLFRLSQAFLQSNENITMFAKTPGAMQILVKELTGHESEQQIRAAETLCNLSLGDEVVCEKIASQAGSYLVTFLESTDFRLRQSCLWTLTNISATGGKGLDTLLAMGIVSKCIDLIYSKNYTQSMSTLEDAAICLSLILRNKKLGDESSQNICMKAFFDQINNLGWNNEENDPRLNYLMELIFYSSIINSEYKFSDEQIELITSKIVNDLGDYKDNLMSSDIPKVLLHVRILSNFIFIYKEKYLDILNKILVAKNSYLNVILNIFFSCRDDNFQKEVFWLIKNLLNIIDCDSTKLEIVNSMKIPCLNKI